MKQESGEYILVDSSKLKVPRAFISKSSLGLITLVVTATCAASCIIRSKGPSVLKILFNFS